LDELLSRAMFTSATPFSIVENQNWLKFFKTLRPTYNPPSRKTISTTLLEKEYLRTYNKVYENILEAKVYAVQLDGWSNIRCVTSIMHFFLDYNSLSERFSKSIVLMYWLNNI